MLKNIDEVLRSYNHVVRVEPTFGYFKRSVDRVTIIAYVLLLHKLGIAPALLRGYEDEAERMGAEADDGYSRFSAWLFSAAYTWSGSTFCMNPIPVICPVWDWTQ